ncbi:SPFH domain, Band 7 family protein [Halpernia humi]|uniref:SPFH domain, Band 7 family protein n=1 Tax=Halpernia humi TaxID=493375 RepID=A0A1H6AKM3_9FLAO|nr:prohibitin family protein [Halpernia humi]SEG48780.1 SPFH domain, Band 7 family protein [Halpernia humi]
MSWLLVILGILILFFGTSFIKNLPPNGQVKNLKGSSTIVGVGLIVLGVLLASIVQVETGYIGVKKLFGKVQPEILESGMSLINPLMDVEKLDIRTQNYTMSGVKNEGQVEGDDAIKVLTNDGLEVTMDLTVLYRLNQSDAPRLLKETGANYTDKIIRPLARTKIRDNAVRFDAVALYSQKRELFQSLITKDIEDAFKKRGIILENILIRNISLPAAVRSTIEQKIQAEQEAQKMQFVLQKERQEAERKRVEAQGISDYQNKINASLTPELIQYEQISAYKELAQSPNAKIIVMGKSDAPIILNGK